SAQFTAWDDTLIHNDQLNATSLPKLEAENSGPIMYGISNVSNSAPVMSFSYSSHLYDSTISITEQNLVNCVTPFFNGTTKFAELGIVTDNSIDFYFEANDSNTISLFKSVEYRFEPIVYPVIVADLDNNDLDEIVMFAKDIVYVTNNYETTSYNLTSQITEAPTYCNGLFFIQTEDNFLVFDPLLTGNEFISYSTESTVNFVVAGKELTYLVTDNSIEQFGTVAKTELPNSFTKYKPALITYSNFTSSDNKVILMSDDNILYEYSNGNVELIYDYSEIITEEATNLAVSFDFQAEYVIFAAGNTVYANYLDGTAVRGFPRVLHDYKFTGLRDLIIIDNDYLSANNSYGVIFYLPVGEQNYLAFDLLGNQIAHELSLMDNDSHKFYSWSIHSKKIYSVSYSENSVMINWNNIELSGEQLIWNINDNNSHWIEIAEPNPVMTIGFDAYAFPNPAKDEQFTVRISGLHNECTLSIYSISGKLVYKSLVKSNNLEYVDTIIPADNLSSGVYFGVVNNGKTTQFKIAIEK
ncbi:MAG: hypothetical protein B6226_05815, partial [Candidatus Cloacimonetes bacterium 4572_65]